MASLRTQMLADPAEVSRAIHAFVDGLAHRLNARSGYLDRLDAAIEDGEMLDERSIEALYLNADVVTLRQLAERIEKRLQSLVGRAPRLRLVAAE